MHFKHFSAVVPLVALALFSMMAALYGLDRQLYYSILDNAGIETFRYPFLDWEYIGAGAKCWLRGVDVYLNDPCDVLNRPHGYSPLWLRATFIPTGQLWTNILGAGIDLWFFLSLFMALKPINWREVIIFVLACTSSMVIFALERANVDVILFSMVVTAGLLSTGPVLNRLLSYALLLFAGLLKFYPLIALVTALRERPRISISIALISIATVLLFFVDYRDELAAMSRNVPAGGAESGPFGAKNLPQGLAAMLGQFVPHLRDFCCFKQFRQPSSASS